MVEIKRIIPLFLFSISITLISIMAVVDTYAQGPPCPPACPPENIVSLEAEQRGSTILLTFENEGVRPPQSFDIERDSGSGFQPLQTLGKDVNRLVINNANGNQIYEILDSSNIQPLTTYTYRVVSVGQGQGNNVISTPVTISTDSSSFDLTRTTELKGRWIDTPLNIRALNDGNGNPINNPPPRPIFYLPEWELIPDISALTENDPPLFTSSINPDNESFMVDLQPIEITGGFTDEDCVETLRIGYRQNDDFGQQLYMFVSIIEDQIVTTHQLDIPVNLHTKRVFNDDFVIQVVDQTITDFENLEVQIDVRGDFEVNPLDHRSLSVHYVEFLVPESDSYC